MKDSISLLCRGVSLGFIDKLPTFEYCVIVNAFQKELEHKEVSKYVKQHKVIHVCSTGCEYQSMIAKGVYSKFNFQKIVLPYIQECVPSQIDADRSKRMQYFARGKEIKNNKGEILPIDLMSDDNKSDMIAAPRYTHTSPSTGMDALLYTVNDLKKKEIHIIGMDFYDGVGYMTKSSGMSPITDENAISRGDSIEAMKSFFLDFSANHKDVNFIFYTVSNIVFPDRLNVTMVRV